MSEKELKQFADAIKKFTKKLSRNKKASKSSWVKIGIIAPNGNLR